MSVSGLELNVATGIRMLILALILWSVKNGHDLTVSSAVQTAELKSLRTQIKIILDTATDDRYRAADAARDFRLVNERFKGVDRRLDKLEGVK